jgi:hypothetical protein
MPPGPIRTPFVLPVVTAEFVAPPQALRRASAPESAPTVIPARIRN